MRQSYAVQVADYMINRQHNVESEQLNVLRYLRTVAPIKYGARSIAHLSPDDTYLLQRDLNPSAIDFFFKKKNRDTTAAAFS